MIPKDYSRFTLSVAGLFAFELIITLIAVLSKRISPILTVIFLVLPLILLITGIWSWIYNKRRNLQGTPVSITVTILSLLLLFALIRVIRSTQ